MNFKFAIFIAFTILIVIFFPIFLLLYTQYLSVAAPIKASLVIDVKKISGPIPGRWKALAQGGEEKDKRMLADVVPQISALYPRYIRIDHIYDYYDVVRRDSFDKLQFNWQKLDDTVCDIFHTGAKPFFSLGYMPSALSEDGSAVSEPKSWEEWSILVQKTVERYSGTDTRLCGQIADFWLTDIYYEVWNEPDLETFGSWRHSYGKKDYKTLYFYSALGAQKATRVNRFFLGGPATTSLYRNWITSLLDYVESSKLRLDFISWHHYSQATDDFDSQIHQLNTWLSAPEYEKYRSLPKIISEWGYDSDPNPIAETEVGAAHSIASIRNFFRENIELAFFFEIKDGPVPRWGILSYDGKEKPRYRALRFLNQLQGNEIFVEGEGTFVKTIVSATEGKVNAVLVNYDKKGVNTENVPIKFINLDPGSYAMNTIYIDGKTISVKNINIPQGGSLERSVIMPPNSVVAVELIKE
ncbi:hypothetical protein A2774_01065 [Candidatus Roizmanbacteria bacterium RIFCSPHIGHO2_01_FULL_39_12c]|uniref:Glycosyl hydrolases family 39 N-terminal catalytic domain-containing protein n=1 Tax=Candidatus Roizmanbacteria bacterium RIFCSPHIGHO2_01_FULL_39_12c TaxID=1802031 RepID=A0A1F7G7S2_9BACT|nr:MAG: hypothetical protein A2774_01065 [Candidatus Roizmanbacteria bacterium RIFCSPHIGHO2_01_FULL_39_12c]OGK46421.1 MAG: hypothetical protein A2963_01470 [Candidatus Roizmanbacteria bacterium RIFCSPLOWO2_01_FULL_40_13]